jgi:tRNA(Ile)-lysidine synthase
MLLLAHAAMPERIVAATVDHGLRPEAAAEAVYVSEICGHLNVPHSILRPETSITGSIQASARAARYALLRDHADTAGCNWIATAHHADDQLETVLMRVARGSGIDGLSAVRERQGRTIRPLLGFEKSELQDICAGCGVVPVEDPSNSDSNFDRVAMRQWLAGSTHPFEAKRAVRTASAFADASEALDWMTEELASARLTRDSKTLSLDCSDLPIELRRRLLSRALSEIQHGYVPRGEAADRALFALEKGEAVMLGDVLIKGGLLWHFSSAPPRKENGGK